MRRFGKRADLVVHEESPFNAGATQPEDEAALWNPKGYVNNARPRIRVRAS
jgi:hypothetical protein